MRLWVVNTPCGSIKPAGSRTHDIAAVRLIPLRIALLRVSLLRHPAVRIGHADDRVVVRWRGARLEGFQKAATARTGAHAALGVDADELDAGGHLEGNRGLVGEGELQEILGDRRGQMTTGHAAAEIARLVEADIDSDHEVRREADEPG